MLTAVSLNIASNITFLVHVWSWKYPVAKGLWAAWASKGTDEAFMMFDAIGRCLETAHFAPQDQKQQNSPSGKHNFGHHT